METIERFLTSLANKEVILYPTDTIWGLGWDATDTQVIERIKAIKERAASKSLISLMHPSFIADYADIDVGRLLELYAQQQTPTTFILPHPKNIPQEMTMNNTIAVRIPFHCPYLMEVLEKFGKPIVSTSANISWHASPKLFDDIEQEIINAVDFTVPKDYYVGTQEPSTIISYLDTNLRIR